MNLSQDWPNPMRMRTQDIQIVIPSMGRPHMLYGAIKSLIEASDGDWACTVVHNGGRDVETKWIIDTRITYNFIGGGTVGFWQALNMVLKNSKRELIGFFGNDTVFHADCIANMLICWNYHFPDNAGILTTRDDVHDGYHAAHGFISRTFLNILYGEVIFPPYQHGYGDAELTQFSRDLNLLRYCPQSYIEHRHPDVKTRERDWVDNAAFKTRKEDNKLYSARFIEWRKTELDKAQLRLAQLWAS